MTTYDRLLVPYLHRSLRVGRHIPNARTLVSVHWKRSMAARTQMRKRLSTGL